MVMPYEKGFLTVWILNRWLIYFYFIISIIIIIIIIYINLILIKSIGNRIGNSLVSFTIVVLSHAVILGRKAFCVVSTWSTAKLVKQN